MRAYHYVEQLVADAGGPVRVAEIRERLCDELGLRHSHCTTALKLAQDVVAAKRGYVVHLGNVRATRDDLRPVVALAQDLLSKQDQVSVEQLFRNKQVTCLSAGILSARMLYELLALHAWRDLSTPRYPLVRRAGASDGSTIREEIVSFVKVAERPVPREKLYDIFVRTKKYGGGDACRCFGG